MNETAELKPIVDPDGEFLWVPVTLAKDQEAAVAYARNYWPDMPTYEVGELEYFVIQTYEEADEDGRLALDELGAKSFALLCGADEGQAYWFVHCCSGSGAVSDA